MGKVVSSLSIIAEELFHMPGDGGRCELVRGEIIRLKPAGAVHGVVTARIGSALDKHVEANDLGVCSGAETGFILERDPDTVRAPDAAVVLASRAPASGVPVGYWPFAPDLAAEVISPSDRLGDDVLPGFLCPVQRLFPSDS